MQNKEQPSITSPQGLTNCARNTKIRDSSKRLSLPLKVNQSGFMLINKNLRTFTLAQLSYTLQKTMCKCA